MNDILRRSLMLPKGVTVVCFTYGLDDSNDALNLYLKRRNIPVITVVCSSTVEIEEAKNGAIKPIYRLDSIRKEREEESII